MRIGMTEIRLHPALLLYAGYAFLTGHGTFMAIATLSILLHEAAHALASAAMGEIPDYIELTPLGAMMRLDDKKRLPPQRLVVVLLAGPAMTLAICAVSLHLTMARQIPFTVGQLLFMSNLSILIINLIPALPLDGGRLLALLLGLWFRPRVISKIMQTVGSVIGLGLIGLNVYTSWKLGGWNLSLSFIGCCIIYCSSVGTTTRAAAELRSFMERKIWFERKQCLPMTCRAALHTQPLRRLVRDLPQRRMVMFVCLEAGSMNYLGSITEAEVIQQYLDAPGRRLSEAVEHVPGRRKCTKSGTN